MGDEEEQVLALLLSKGAAETALADEMGRLRVQEEVRLTQMLDMQRLLMHWPLTFVCSCDYTIISGDISLEYSSKRE